MAALPDGLPAIAVICGAMRNPLAACGRSCPRPLPALGTAGRRLIWHGMPATIYCALSPVEKYWTRVGAEGRAMRDTGRDAGYDFNRYRKLLAEAVDEQKRLAFIDLLVEERARDQLEAQRLADRKAMTATVIAQVLGAPRA